MRDNSRNSNHTLPFMEERNKKYPMNVKGPYYIDDGCVGCGTCCNLAPELITMGEGAVQSHVFKQPVGEEEIGHAEEALRFCPVKAICNDGDK